MPLIAGIPEGTILRLLSKREMDGYALARAIRRAQTEAFATGEGKLYAALHALEVRHLLRSRLVRAGNRTRVCYRTSPGGAKRLAQLSEV